MSKLGALLLALLFLWIAVASPLSSLHHQLLFVHMVQPVLLMAVIPPLTIIGAAALPLLRWLRRPRIHPALCWLAPVVALIGWRSEEHTSELQSPYVISYAVFCLKKKK